MDVEDSTECQLKKVEGKCIIKTTIVEQSTNCKSRIINYEMEVETGSLKYEVVDIIFKTEPEPEVENNSTLTTKVSTVEIVRRAPDENEIEIKEEQIECENIKKSLNTNDSKLTPIVCGVLECDVCGKQENSRFRMLQHMRKHNTRFKCELCNYNTAYGHHMKVHLRTHTGEKPYDCKECGKLFTQKTSLAVHLKSHRGDKLHKCEYCEKLFSQKCHLLRHSRCHTGEKPYSCKYCKKSFSRSCALLEHIRIHNDDKQFKCELCGYKFIRRSKLKTHLQIHIAEKLFECKHCDKSFVQKSNLTVHLRIHNDEKPFKCEYCKKSFNHKGSYNRHNYRKHFALIPRNVIDIEEQNGHK